MSFFEDSRIGKERALFIRDDKDDRSKKTTTLIVHSHVIGRFSEKWDYDKYPPNLPNWSQAVSSNNGSEITILLNSHHTNINCLFTTLQIFRARHTC